MTNVTGLVNATSQPNHVINFKNTIIGSAFIIHGLFYIIPYIPVTIVIWRPPLITNPAYKVMAIMAVFDLISLGNSCIFNGTASLIGLRFMDHYFLFRFLGAVSCWCWYSYAALSLVLVVNRIIELSSTHFTNTLFGVSFVLKIKFVLYTVQVSGTYWCDLLIIPFFVTV